MLNAHIVTASQPSRHIHPCQLEQMYTRITLDGQHCCYGCQAHSLSTFAAQSIGFR
jgi:hypothetical protein